MLSLIALGAIPIMPDEFIEKTITKIAPATSVCRTWCSISLEYCTIMPGEITVHIPVIFPDTVNIRFSMNISRGIFKGGNYLHPSVIEGGIL
jgi:hypothetical protein